jgi:hypothetical protein
MQHKTCSHDHHHDHKKVEPKQFITDLEEKLILEDVGEPINFADYTEAQLQETHGC